MTLLLPTLAAAFCVWLVVRIINRRERWAIYVAALVASFVLVAALPLFIRGVVKREVNANLVYEVFLRAVLVEVGLAVAGVHLAMSLAVAGVHWYRNRRISGLWYLVLLLPFVAVAIYCGWTIQVTVPVR